MMPKLCSLFGLEMENKLKSVAKTLLFGLGGLGKTEKYNFIYLALTEMGPLNDHRLCLKSNS